MSFAAENMMQSLGGQAGRSSAENGTQGPGERQRGGSRRPRVLQGALLQRAQAPGRCSPPWLRVCGDWDAEIKNERKNPYHPSLPKYIYVHLHPFGCVFQHLQCFPDYLRDLLRWLGNQDGTHVPQSRLVSSAVTLLSGSTAQRSVSVTLHQTHDQYFVYCLVFKKCSQSGRAGFPGFPVSQSKTLRQGLRKGRGGGKKGEIL